MAAKLTCQSPRTIRREIARGRIKALRFGAKNIRIRVVDLEVYINAAKDRRVQI